MVDYVTDGARGGRGDGRLTSERERRGQGASPLPVVDSGPSGGVNPPLLTGGLLQNGQDCPDSESVDFLTVSVAGQTGRDLLAVTFDDEAGYGGRGFAKSERRSSIGGECWRRWEPFQPSNRWGLDYESWEWSGASARWPSEWLAGRDAVPSRVDVAWDFCVPDHVMPETLSEAVGSHVRGRRLLEGVSGQGGVNTRYIGSRSSARRIKIYRKDLRDRSWFVQFGPTLRVELTLKDEQALAWWSVWCESQQDGYAAAAAHVLDMTGTCPRRDCGELPELVRAEASEDADALFQFLQQHGQRVHAWECAGVPLLELCSQRAGYANRMGKHRINKLIKRVRAAGVSQVVALVREMMTSQFESVPGKKVKRRPGILASEFDSDA